MDLQFEGSGGPSGHSKSKHEVCTVSALLTICSGSLFCPDSLEVAIPHSAFQQGCTYSHNLYILLDGFASPQFPALSSAATGRSCSAHYPPVAVDRQRMCPSSWGFVLLAPQLCAAHSVKGFTHLWHPKAESPSSCQPRQAPCPRCSPSYTDLQVTMFQLSPGFIHVIRECPRRLACTPCAFSDTAIGTP